MRRNATRSEMDSVVKRIESFGGRIKKANYPEYPIEWMPEIYCWIPFDMITEVAKDSLIYGIGGVSLPFTKVGDYTTVGDTQLRADLARQQFNVDGSGVKVGVISDGIDHWEESRNSGDLPPLVYSVTNHDMGDEGTAMLEIIHDIAPGAELFFGGVGFADTAGANDMADTIAALYAQGCKVIVDDIGFYDVPYFYDDYLNQTIYNYINIDDITYISACGNSGEKAYDAFFRDYNGWHEFWTYSGNPVITNRVQISPPDTAVIFLQWASSWEDPDEDYDLYLVSIFGDTVARGMSYHGGNRPEEYIYFPNNTGDEFFNIMIRKVSGSDVEFKLLLHSGRPWYTTLQYTYPNWETGINRPVRQIFGHPSAQDVISVAAYSAFDVTTLESYSSRGPNNAYSAPGNWIQRKTPTITATDSVETKIGNLGYFGNPFGGTSAAAPHIAGIAALYYDKYGTATPPENFYDDLTSTATTIHTGTGGTYNDQSGYGKADAFEALGGGPIQAQVEVDQVNHAGTSVGDFDHWENNDWENYNAPHTFPWEDGSDHVLKAEQEILNDEKYHDWDGTDYINHNRFHIESGTSEITAHLDYTEPAVVKTYLLSADGADPANDVIEFKDPWLVIEGDPQYYDPPHGYRNLGMAASLKTYPSPLNITLASEFKGVFLNQAYDDPPKPYYSVRAPQQQVIPFHGQAIGWYFQGWSGTDVQFKNPDQSETAVVFQQPNAVAQAEYKGHFVSNNATPTAPNNARRMVKEDNLFPANNPLHLVYEDAGAIWYTTSTDKGETWSDEERISDNWYPQTPCHNPAIAQNNDSLHVVWLQDIEGFVYELYYRAKDLSTGQWSEQVHIDNIPPGENPIPQPSIASRYRYFGGKYHYRVWIAVAYEDNGISKVYTYYRNTHPDSLHNWGSRKISDYLI